MLRFCVLLAKIFILTLCFQSILCLKISSFFKYIKIKATKQLTIEEIRKGTEEPNLSHKTPVKKEPNINAKLESIVRSPIADRVGKGMRTAPRDALLAANADGNTGDKFC